VPKADLINLSGLVTYGCEGTELRFKLKRERERESESEWETHMREKWWDKREIVAYHWSDTCITRDLRLFALYVSPNGPKMTFVLLTVTRSVNALSLTNLMVTPKQL
jgi:hypothetical protein